MPLQQWYSLTGETSTIAKITFRFPHTQTPEEGEDLKKKLDNPGYFYITPPPTNQSSCYIHMFTGFTMTTVFCNICLYVSLVHRDVVTSLILFGWCMYLGLQMSHLRGIRNLYCIYHFQSPQKDGEVMLQRERKIDNRVHIDKAS